MEIPIMSAKLATETSKMSTMNRIKKHEKKPAKESIARWKVLRFNTHGHKTKIIGVTDDSVVEFRGEKSRHILRLRNIRSVWLGKATQVLLNDPDAAREGHESFISIILKNDTQISYRMQKQRNRRAIVFLLLGKLYELGKVPVGGESKAMDDIIATDEHSALRIDFVESHKRSGSEVRSHDRRQSSTRKMREEIKRLEPEIAICLKQEKTFSALAKQSSQDLHSAADLHRIYTVQLAIFQKQHSAAETQLNVLQHRLATVTELMSNGSKREHIAERDEGVQPKQILLNDLKKKLKKCVRDMEECVASVTHELSAHQQNKRFAHMKQQTSETTATEMHTT